MGNSNGFAASYDLTGKHNCMTTVSTSAPSNTIGQAVHHHGGDVFLVGYIKGEFARQTTSGGQDGFVARMTDAGALQ